jgi:hypothetical protein
MTYFLERPSNVHQFGWCVKLEDIYQNIALRDKMIFLPLSNAWISQKLRFSLFVELLQMQQFYFRISCDSTSNGNWSIDEAKFGPFLPIRTIQDVEK